MEKLTLDRQTIYVPKLIYSGRGRTPLWPYIGTYTNCPECSKKFELDYTKRSRLRLKQYSVFFCSHKCQLKRNHREFNADIGRDNRHKISKSRLKLFEGKSEHYRKVNGVHEHRTVAEEMLGRKLKKGEIVHHKNGNKRDNRKSNLQVMTQSEHITLHRLQRLRIKK